MFNFRVRALVVFRSFFVHHVKPKKIRRRIFHVMAFLLAMAMATIGQPMTVVPGGTPDVLWKAFNIAGTPAGVTGLTATTTTYFANTAGREQWGTYSNVPAIGNVKMKDGILLTSAHVRGALGPNKSSSTTSEKLAGAAFFNGWGYPGDPDLQAISGAPVIMDAATFLLSFKSDATVLGFTYTFCFGTEEWKEFLGSQFNDLFICLFDGKNIALDGNGRVIALNSGFFGVDNIAPIKIDLEYDGFTYVLKVSKKLQPGNHTLKFAVGDAKDGVLDCGVFLSDFRFELSNDTIVTPIIDLVSDQTFTVPETTPALAAIGNVENLITKVGVNINVLTPAPDIAVATGAWATATSWGLSVAPAAVLNFARQRQYKIPVQAQYVTAQKTYLDTAVMTINVTEDPSLRVLPVIDSAVIYDKNGDGRADSAAMFFGGTIPAGYLIKSKSFVWPVGGNNYTLTSNDQTLGNTNTIRFGFTPAAGAPVATSGTSEITLTLDSLGKVITRKSPLKDGIGALLKDASVYLRSIPGNDTFEVNITEPVAVSAISGKSFVLIKGGSAKRVELSAIAGSVTDLGGETYVRFATLDLGTDAPTLGDSLQIFYTGSVVDKRAIKSHQNNTPVPLKIIDHGSKVRLIKAAYYDKNGDGHPDEIAVWVNGRKWEDFADPIYNAIKLPGYRTLTKNSKTLASGKMLLLVSEGMVIPNTGVRAEDLLTSDSVSLGGGYFIEKGSLPVLDSMAPVALTATLVDSVKAGAIDELTVKFSEGISNTTLATPFWFFKQGTGTKFNGVLSSVSGSGDTRTWRLVSLDAGFGIVANDSLNIRTDVSNPIQDAQPIAQINSGNKKCPINVNSISDGISITKAAYFDRNADGFCDEISVWFNGNTIEKNAALIYSSIKLPAYRMLTKQSQSVVSGVMKILVTEGIAVPRTSVTVDDLVSITDSVALGDGFFLKKSSVPVLDSMAPIALSAALLDAVKVGAIDELSVKFSEIISNPTAVAPFWFYKQGVGTQFNGVLSNMSGSGDTRTWHLVSLDAGYTIANNDSLNIRTDIGNPIQDGVPVVQKNSGNKKCPIEVTLFPDGARIYVTFGSETMIPNLVGSVYIPSDNMFIPVLPNGVAMDGTTDGKCGSCNAGTNKAFVGSVIHMEIPGPTSYEFKIFSTLGEFVAEGKGRITASDLPKLEILNESGKYHARIVWTGKTAKEDRAGNGSYILLAKLDMAKDLKAGAPVLRQSKKILFGYLRGK